jgi:hypothetical protein
MGGAVGLGRVAATRAEKTQNPQDGAETEDGPAATVAHRQFIHDSISSVISSLVKVPDQGSVDANAHLASKKLLGGTLAAQLADRAYATSLATVTLVVGTTRARRSVRSA